MREHEVPTHVQAEDKVLLWFTFPQIVAVVAVCAVGYGAYHYLPFGPVALRLATGIFIGVVGIALIVGKVGGRGLPLVAADLLKFNLGARRYAGASTQLARSEAPPVPESKPDPLRLLAKKAAGGIGRAVKAARKRGRPPFRPHGWFGKRRHARNPEKAKPRIRDTRLRKPWYRLLAVAGLLTLTVIAFPGSAMADGPGDESPGWRLGEIYFQPPEPVPGRRIYVEKLAVGGDTAIIVLRAAHDLDLRVRAFGGTTGRTLMTANSAIVHSGQRATYNLPLNGPNPSFTFSWTDSLGFSGAVSLKSHQIPYPMPSYIGELCKLQLTSLTWTPGSIEGVVASQCITSTREEVDLPVYGGHITQSVPALMDATVTAVTGTVIVAAGSHSTTAAFVSGGETRFTLAVPGEKAVHKLEIKAELTAALNVPRPPMLQTTHHPARTDVYTRTVTLSCKKCAVTRTVRIRVYHPEHVRAVEVRRGAVTPNRPETLPLAHALGVAADAPFTYLTVPTPAAPPPRAEQTDVGDSSWWGEPW